MQLIEVVISRYFRPHAQCAHIERPSSVALLTEAPPGLTKGQFAQRTPRIH